MQYDDLVEEWWAPRGAFCALHWLAAARAALVPPASAPGAVLLDVACGGGLLGPHVAGAGYTHLGVDIGEPAARVARDHGVVAVRGDVYALPVRSGSVDVLVAGEIFEHVHDLDAMVAEIARVLRPGGRLICDTLADTRRCKFLLVTLGERLAIAPRGIHDPDLFVDPTRLRRICATHGIDLTVRGIRPAIPDAIGWLLRRRDEVRMVPSRSTGMVYQGIGVRAPA